MNHVPAFWRVYGGTLLGIAALALMCVFNTLTADLAELRREIAQERTRRAELVSRADFDTLSADPEARIAAVEMAFAEPAATDETPLFIAAR